MITGITNQALILSFPFKPIWDNKLDNHRIYKYGRMASTPEFCTNEEHLGLALYSMPEVVTEMTRKILPEYCPVRSLSVHRQPFHGR